MKKKSGRVGRKKLYKQYAWMVLIVQLVTLAIFIALTIKKPEMYDAFGVTLLLLLLANLLATYFIIRRTRLIVADPIRAIQNAVREYVTTRDSKKARSLMEDIYSANEIGVLAEDVDRMIQETDEHIRKIEAAGIRHKNLTADVMEALASAIDAKDTYTNGHSRRVAIYSKRIAEEVGLSEEMCDQVYFAALLHDVGKIGVPIEILTKQGRLTEEEFAKIKQHPVLGSQILEKISDCPWLRIGALYHHERYNGKGYPEGLAGEEIPEIARIIAVADAYDAMTSNRSYRDAIPQHIVREELVKGSGVQFDPVFARVMVRMIDEDSSYEMKENGSEEEVSGETGLLCRDIYQNASDGAEVTREGTVIRMISRPEEGLPLEDCLPTLIVFDSLDGKVHPGEEQNKDLLYFEYAKVRLDGQVQAEHIRAFEVRENDHGTDLEHHDLGDTERGRKFKIEAVRSRDHVLLQISTEEKMYEVILALPDPARYVFLSISGEHCEIHNIRSDRAKTAIPAELIPRIAEEISYVRDCPEGDLPNLEIDGPETACTKGISIHDRLTLTFHTMSYPTARLIWHCPALWIYSSADGRPGGEVFTEYALLKLDGELREEQEICHSNVQADQTENFEGWNSWIEKNKQGFDVTVTIRRMEGRIVISTENLGLALTCVTTLPEEAGEVYASLTGDQCALTDIHIK